MHTIVEVVLSKVVKQNCVDELESIEKEHRLNGLIFRFIGAENAQAIIQQLGCICLSSCSSFLHR